MERELLRQYKFCLCGGRSGGNGDSCRVRVAGRVSTVSLGAREGEREKKGNERDRNDGVSKMIMARQKLERELAKDDDEDSII